MGSEESGAAKSHRGFSTGSKPASRTASRSSITTEVLHQIRMDIILGRYEPGEALVEVALAETYKVSRGSLRMAFAMLEKEGMIRTQPNGRRVVVGLDVDFVKDVFDIRYVLECKAIETVLGQSKLDYDPLLEILGTLKAAENANGYMDYCEMDIDFHRALVLLAGNRALLLAWEATSPIMLALLKMNADEAYQQEYQETFIERHYGIVELVMSRNPSLYDYIKHHIDAGLALSVARVEAYQKKYSRSR